MDSQKSTNIPNCLFFNDQYAKIQQFDHYLPFADESFLICFNLKSDIAISLPKSPFGGLFTHNTNKTELFRFYENVENSLREKGAKQINIVQPQKIYPSIPGDWLIELGYECITAEIAHYVPLAGNLNNRIHQMEKRKLKASQNIQLMEESENLKDVYEFLVQCRKAQGLEISLPYEQLKAQFDAFPGRFKVFTARKEGHLISAVITNSPTDNIAYYFLPGTLPEHRKQSPMVSLIKYLYDKYATAGFEYLDFGISSINGTPQSSLITFKEHMGGIRNERITYTKVI